MVMFVGMNKILLVTSSALGEHSTSRRIAQRLVEAASEQGLHKILERDLRSLAHVDLELLRALRTEVAARTPDQTVRVANADAVIEEVEEADLIVITCPIYASSIPDRKSVVEGKHVSVRVDHGGRRIIKKKKINNHQTN